MENLIVDPEFKHIIPPLSSDEYAQLEANILAEGKIHDPIIVWDNIIIDGHHRWEILKEHPEIPYEVQRMEFGNRYEVISWICRNQIGRRNVDKGQQRKLIAIDAKAMKHAGGDRKSDLYRKENELCAIESRKNQIHQNEEFDSVHTRDVLSETYHVSPATVDRAIAYDKGMEAADEISPGFRSAIEGHEITAPREVIERLPKVSHEIGKEALSKVEEANKESDKTERRKRLNEAKAIINNGVAPRKEGYTLKKFQRDVLDIADRVDLFFNTYFVCEHPEMLETKDGLQVAYEALDAVGEKVSYYRGVLDTYK